jgi:transcription initiation factor TFIIF subunit alpha
MSASPAAGPNGTPTPTSGGPPPVVRRIKKTDALRTYRKQPVRPMAKKKDSNLGSQPITIPNVPPNLFKQIATPGQNGSRPRERGWDGPEPALGTYCDYPLTTTKREMRENLRYHVARFQAKRKVDPTDQDEFIRPVSLHRRDPRQPPPGKVVKDEDVVMEDAMDDKEREKQEIARASKEAQRAADLAQIAPSGNNASALAQKKHTSFRNEKTTQVFKTDENEEQKKMSDLRYEEGLPWHLEDAENNQTWVGTYEAALSHTNVMFIMDGPNFRMIPLEKWYKFTQKNQFKALTIEEAEAQMNKKSRASRWAMHTAEQQQEAAEREMVRQMTKGLYSKVKGEAAYIKKELGGDGGDDLDMDADDLFQDDDEQPGFEPDIDEDTKFTKEKIKQEQLGANLFGEADENEVEEEFKKEEEIAALNKRLGKGTIKSLRKREKNYTYDSDSSNPYSSSVSPLSLASAHRNYIGFLFSFPFHLHMCQSSKTYLDLLHFNLHFGQITNYVAE